ncbi:hypothetical protein [Variovorax sp. OV084]|jgi:hypothetical protein|uniref:hypothetical protein n=1 Tax=Variovorax sp. OV084 TaxID=1882777 RepID=UPI0015A6B301
MAHSAAQRRQISAHRLQTSSAFSLFLAMIVAAVVHIAAQSKSSAMQRARALEASLTHAAAQRLQAVAQASQSSMQRPKSEGSRPGTTVAVTRASALGRFVFDIEYSLKNRIEKSGLVFRPERGTPMWDQADSGRPPQLVCAPGACNSKLRHRRPLLFVCAAFVIDDRDSQPRSFVLAQEVFASIH